MHHDTILKKLNFDFLLRGGGLQAKYLLPCCYICDMQHDRALIKLNFDLLTPPPKSNQGVRRRPSIENHVWYVSYLLYLCKYTD